MRCARCAPNCSKLAPTTVSDDTLARGVNMLCSLAHARSCTMTCVVRGYNPMIYIRRTTHNPKCRRRAHAWHKEQKHCRHCHNARHTWCRVYPVHRTIMVHLKSPFLSASREKLDLVLQDFPCLTNDLLSKLIPGNLTRLCHMKHGSICICILSILFSEEMYCIHSEFDLLNILHQTSRKKKIARTVDWHYFAKAAIHKVHCALSKHL